MFTLKGKLVYIANLIKFCFVWVAILTLPKKYKPVARLTYIANLTKSTLTPQDAYPA